ncbi:hypothetical protein OC845_006511 [Tilletia horrida]|nr:hypothetical protein OC845_006511 [Tilletia horrida]
MACSQPAHLIALGRILNTADTLSLSSVLPSDSAEQDGSAAAQARWKKEGSGGGAMRRGKVEEDGSEGEEEDEAMEVDEALGVSAKKKQKSGTTSIQAQEAARLRGALSVSQVKQIVGGFL